MENVHLITTTGITLFQPALFSLPTFLLPSKIYSKIFSKMNLILTVLYMGTFSPERQQFGGFTFDSQVERILIMRVCIQNY